MHNWAYRYSFSGKENEEKTNILQCSWQLVMWKKDAVAEMIDNEKAKEGEARCHHMRKNL